VATGVGGPNSESQAVRLAKVIATMAMPRPHLKGIMFEML